MSSSSPDSGSGYCTALRDWNSKTSERVRQLLLASEANLRDRSGTPAANAKRSSSSRFWVAFAIIICVGLVVIVVSYLTIWMSGDDESVVAPLEALERPPEYYEYAVMLSETLNASANPCDDFEAFVCSRWRYERSSALKWRLLFDVRYLWESKIAEELRDRRLYYAPMLDVADSFSLCTKPGISSNASHTARALQQLVHFMADMGILWPPVKHLTKNGDPLDALFNMTVNYLIPLWFHIKLVDNATNVHGDQRAVIIEASAYSSFWDVLYRELSPDKARAYMEPFFKTFSGLVASVASDSTGCCSTENVRDEFVGSNPGDDIRNGRAGRGVSERVESNTSRKVIQSESDREQPSLVESIDRDKSDGWDELQDIFHFTRKLAADIVASRRIPGRRHPQTYALRHFNILPCTTPDQWLAVINRYLKPKPPFSLDDSIIVANSHLMRAVGRAMAAKNCDKRFLLSHLGWWFLQDHAGLADSQFFNHKYGDTATTQKLLPLFCEQLTEDANKILVTENHLALAVSATHRSEVEHILSGVKEIVAKRARHICDMDPTIGELAANRVQQVRVHLWPDGSYSSRSALRRIYSLSPSISHSGIVSALESWTRDRLRNSRHMATDVYHETMRLAHGYWDEAFAYSYALNSVTMPILVAHPPFYLERGTPSVNYGALGASFARALVRAFDVDSLRYLANNTLFAGWEGVVALDDVTSDKATGTSSARHHPRHRRTCFNIGDHALDALALDVAFEAFQHHVTDTKMPSRLLRFTNGQLFFISYCHAQCRMRPFDSDCNRVMYQSKEFAAAFQCSNNPKR